MRARRTCVRLDRGVTSQGSPYTRFRRAVDRGNLLEAEANARELGRLSLEDALDYCDLFARQRRRPPLWELQRACRTKATPKTNRVCASSSERQPEDDATVSCCYFH